jgi:hypothetical protein
MTRYEEMCEVASKARKNWLSRKERCLQCFLSLVNGLKTYCGIPEEQVVFLRRDKAAGEGGSLRPPKDGEWVFDPNAVEYDKDKDEWSLHVLIYVNPPRNFPRQYVTFGLFVTEKDGDLMVRVGPEIPRVIDPNIQSQREEFCQGIVEAFRESFEHPRDPNPRAIGFTVVTSN